MGEQYRCKLIGGQTQSKIVALGDIYGGYWNNEMKTRNGSKNEMKILNEIMAEFVSGLKSWERTLKELDYYIRKKVKKEYGFYLIRENGRDVIFFTKGDM